MQDIAGACIGVPGSGLNQEQRKRVTIGVELASKPELLMFLDEPTSVRYPSVQSRHVYGMCFCIQHRFFLLT